MDFSSEPRDRVHLKVEANSRGTTYSVSVELIPEAGESAASLLARTQALVDAGLVGLAQRYGQGDEAVALAARIERARLDTAAA